MLKNAFCVITCCYYICGLYFQLTRASSPSRLPIGAHPLDEKYYDADVINCKDKSKYFKRDRLNDNFCDCPDGTDEPGTSACPGGKFYCRNVGSTPKFLFSSCVNDHICDCCDGSDEYDGSTICPNTCVMGGIVTYDRNMYDSAEVADMDSTIHLHPTKQGNTVDSSTNRFTGLILFAFLQMVFVIFIVGTRLYRRRQSRRRNSRLMFL